MSYTKEKIDAAMKKLTEEAAELKDKDPCKILVSEYLMDKVAADQAADLILDDKKTLGELNGKMWDRARKAGGGSDAHVPDAELLKMADEYYGLDKLYDNIDVTELLA